MYTAVMRDIVPEIIAEIMYGKKSTYTEDSELILLQSYRNAKKIWKNRVQKRVTIRSEL